MFQEREQRARTKNRAVHNLPVVVADACDDGEDSGGYERDKLVVRSFNGEAVRDDGSSLSAIRYRADGSNRRDWQPSDASMPSSRSERAHSVD